MDDAEGLTEFLHTAEVTVVAVAVLANWDVELDLIVGIVWLSLADIPWDTGTTKHDSGETVVQGILCGNDTDTLGTGLPDSVVSQKFFNLVDAVAKLSSPLVDIVEETDWKILVDTAWTDVGGVETGARDTLVELL